MRLTQILFVFSGILYSITDANPGSTGECIMPDCCEEDCCGTGTSWDNTNCIVDGSSGGFDGEHSEGYDPGCCPRVCCESDCCGNGTYYDLYSDYCIPGPCTCNKFQQAIEQAQQDVADATQAVESAQSSIDAAESTVSDREADAAATSQRLEEARSNVDSQMGIMDALQGDLEAAIEEEAQAVQAYRDADAPVDAASSTTQELGNMVSPSAAPLGDLSSDFDMKEMILEERVGAYNASVERLENGNGSQAEVDQAEADALQAAQDLETIAQSIELLVTDLNDPSGPLTGIEGGLNDFMIALDDSEQAETALEVAISNRNGTQTLIDSAEDDYQRLSDMRDSAESDHALSQQNVRSARQALSAARMASSGPKARLEMAEFYLSEHARALQECLADATKCKAIRPGIPLKIDCEKEKREVEECEEELEALEQALEGANKDIEEKKRAVENAEQLRKDKLDALRQILRDLIAAIRAKLIARTNLRNAILAMIQARLALIAAIVEYLAAKIAFAAALLTLNPISILLAAINLKKATDALKDAIADWNVALLGLINSIIALKTACAVVDQLWGFLRQAIFELLDAMKLLKEAREALQNCKDHRDDLQRLLDEKKRRLEEAKERLESAKERKKARGQKD